MAAKRVPDGYHTLTPYIVVDDPDRLVDFLMAAFGAAGNQRVPGQDGRTGHADVTIGDSHVMMGRAQQAFPALRRCGSRRICSTGTATPVCGTQPATPGGWRHARRTCPLKTWRRGSRPAASTFWRLWTRADGRCGHRSANHLIGRWTRDGIGALAARRPAVGNCPMSRLPDRRLPRSKSGAGDSCVNRGAGRNPCFQARASLPSRKEATMHSMVWTVALAIIAGALANGEAAGKTCGVEPEPVLAQTQTLLRGE